MTTKTGPKKKARALQKRTGWSYMECLRCVDSMTDEAIEVLIKMRTDMKEAAKRTIVSPKIG